jgi:hypothetical protein
MPFTWLKVIAEWHNRIETTFSEITPGGQFLYGSLGRMLLVVTER